MKKHDLQGFPGRMLESKSRKRAVNVKLPHAMFCVLCYSGLYLQALSQLAVVLLYFQGWGDVRAAKPNRSCSQSPFIWLQQALHFLQRHPTHT